MVETPQRETAKICSIQDILSGTYVVQEGWLANYIDLNGEKISRVNIIGIIVSKLSPYNFLIDDGTGIISVTDFNHQKKVEQLIVGEPVLIIGRPRQNNLLKFIACELINIKQLIEEPNWINYRKIQLLNNLKENNISQQKISEELKSLSVSSSTQIKKDFVEPIIEEKNILKKSQQNNVVDLVSADITGENIISFIRKKDETDGCLIEDIVSYFGTNVDKHILTLITMGEIYEIKPGRVKVLE